MKIRFFIPLMLLLIPVACSSSPSNSLEWINTKQLREEPVNQFRIGATRESLVAGEKSQLSAYGMVGSNVRSLNEYVTYYVDGPGWIEREGNRVFYATDSPTGKEGAKIYAILDPSHFGRDEPAKKSNILEIDVHPREEGVEMPDVKSIRVRRSAPHTRKNGE